MAFPFRLNLLQVFRRLGIQTGAKLPQMEENVQLVITLTDLSRLVPAPFEPRGLAGANISGVLGDFSTVQLQSLSPGGIFVETLLVRAEGFDASENYMLDVTVTNLGLPVLLSQINIGGSPVLSRFTGGRLAASTGGASLPAAAAGGTIVFAPGIFVPNQAFFSLTTRTPNENLDVAIFYREVPSVEEIE